MSRARVSRPLALVVGVAAFAALAGVAWAHRVTPSFGWFAYAPLNSAVSYTSSDGRFSTSFTSPGVGNGLPLAYPGLLALVLGGALTVVTAVTGLQMLRTALTAAAAAAALAQVPALSTPLIADVERLLVVLLPASLALLTRRWLDHPGPSHAASDAPPGHRRKRS